MAGVHNRVANVLMHQCIMEDFFSFKCLCEGGPAIGVSVKGTRYREDAPERRLYQPVDPPALSSLALRGVRASSGGEGRGRCVVG